MIKVEAEKIIKMIQSLELP